MAEDKLQETEQLEETGREMPEPADGEEMCRQEREEERRRKQQARQNEQADKLRARQEKKDRRAQARQERRREIKALWRTVEFVMLVTFIVLAIDQAGLYGFLFVWLFIAAAAASVVLMLVGVVRALAKKRTGLILLTGLIGIAASVIWFLFLASSQGMGLGML
ncbi:MAG: hypothetical protein ACLTWK_15810 [Eisenbergiella sp.]